MMHPSDRGDHWRASRDTDARRATSGTTMRQLAKGSALGSALHCVTASGAISAALEIPHIFGILCGPAARGRV